MMMQLLPIGRRLSSMGFNISLMIRTREIRSLRSLSSPNQASGSLAASFIPLPCLRYNVPPNPPQHPLTQGLSCSCTTSRPTMLSLTLKVVWLVFAVLGVPATWFVLIPFASAIGTYWASILYCITITILEGTFCLGMIWGMTPSNMPHWFCVVQTVIISLCFHVLTGVCGCFTWASYLTVFRPYRSIQASASALLWRKAYYFFVIIFPSLAFTAYLVAVLKTNSVQPMNDMHCDNTSPLWPRLLGYAGAPIVLFTPCFLLSIATAVRILGLHTRIRALRTQGDNQSRSIRVGNGDSRMDMLRQSAVTPVSGLTDKPPPPTLDGRQA
ncbi:hypothetical protein BJV74DRAFT_552676 [Russula compacta]|nr:hypothetical protein BJV74DRAFT_552676 [Russula compacta]